MKKPYRIAHIMPWPALGGTEISQLRIAQAVEGDQFTSIMFCVPGESPARDLFAQSGYQTSSFDPVEPSYRRPRAFLRASFNLASELRRLHIDLVHCSDVFAAHYTAIAGRLARLPVISHVRNPYPNISRRDQSFLHAVNKFVFVSRDSWRQFGYKVSERRGRLIYDGIGIGEIDATANGHFIREEFGIPESASVVGMVARVNPQKDYATLAKAAARIVSVNPNVRFLIVGDHSDSECNRKHYEEVKEMLAANRVTPYFIFTGHRPDVQRLMGELDIFVLSSHAEGLPLVLIEALAHSKPVIATAVGGIAEIVSHDKTGLLCRHEDDEQLATHVLSLIHDKDRAAELGAAGRQLVEANFRIQRFGENMADLYGEMLGANG